MQRRFVTLRRNTGWLLVVPILLFSAWLSARSLNAHAIWFDEYYSIYESGGAYYGPLSPIDLTIRVASYSVWPPAYNFTLAGWSALVGWSPVAGRVLSWLCGLLSIAVVYRLARLLMPRDRTYALIVALLLGTSAFYLYYFAELRGYTLHVLLGCSAALLYWRLLARSSGRAVRIAFAASLTLLLYSHPVGQLWFAALAGYHLLFERRSRPLEADLFLFFLAGVLYLPWIAVMLARVAREIESPRGLDPLLMLSTVASAYTNWLTLPIAALCALTLRRLRHRPIRFLWWWLIGVLALALLVDALVPFLFHVRLLIAVLPALLLIAAAGLAELRRYRWLQIAVCGVWLALGVYLAFTPSFMSDLPGAWATVSWSGFDAALTTLNQQASPQDAILFRLTDAPEEHWQNPSLQYYLHDSPLHFSLLSIVDEQMDAPFETRLRAFLDDAPRIWVAAVPTIAPDAETDALAAVLSERYLLCPNLIDLPDMQLDLYVRDRATCTE